MANSRTSAPTRTARPGRAAADRGAFSLIRAEIIASPETGLRYRIERFLG